MPSLSPRSGFTLFELLVVVAISALLLSVSGLFLGGFHSSQRVQVEAQQITALFQAAQGKAVGQEDDSRFGVYIDNPSGGPAAYTLYRVSQALLDAGPPYASVPGVILEKHPLPSGLIFTVPTAGNYKNIIFSRTTGLPNESTSMALGLAPYGRSPLAIYISGNGRIEYRTPDPGEQPAD